MRAIKHAFLSLIRKPTKAIMIFVILLVVYGLVFTGIIIQNSVKSSKEYIRKELGAIVEMRPDHIKAIGDRLSREELVKLDLPVALANEIAKDPLVKELYITEMANAINEDLESAVDMGGGEDDGFSMSVASAGPTGSFIMMGNNTDIPLSFANGTYEITEGRLRNAEDNGKDTLLISEEFAAQNELSVGDFVDFTSNVDQQTYTFEIIGVFKGSSSFEVDLLYTSIESIKKLSDIQGNEESASTVSLQLYDPMDVDKFMKQHLNQMPNDYITLYANDGEYQTLTRPLNLISTIISILLAVVFVAGAIIMLAIITIFVRDRKFEIGLLLSSGEGKSKILSQFVLEILLVSVLAFVVAAGASKISSDYAASWIVKNQLIEDDTQSSSSMAGGIVMAIGGPSGSVNNEVKISDVAREFNVSVDGEVIGNLLLISFALVILSAGAPMLIILGYKPRESLQD